MVVTVPEEQVKFLACPESRRAQPNLEYGALGTGAGPAALT